MSKRIILALFLSLLTMAPVPLSAGLDSFNIQIIRTAFLNGYVCALAQDMDKIKSMKESPDIVRKSAFVEVEQYMNKVLSLNEATNLKLVKKAKENIYRSKGLW